MLSELHNASELGQWYLLVRHIYRDRLQAQIMIYVMSPSGQLEQVFAKATASYVSCSGNAGYCTQSIWSAGFQNSLLTASSPSGPYYAYFAIQGLITGRFPRLFTNIDFAQPTTNISIFTPDANTITGMTQFLSGHCLDGFRPGEWYNTLAGIYLGQNLSLQFMAGEEKAWVNVRTSLQPNRTLRASYLANACFSTLFLIDTLLPLWERWQDIPPSTITHYPQVGTEGVEEREHDESQPASALSDLATHREGRSALGSCGNRVPMQVDPDADLVNGILHASSFTFDLDPETKQRIVLGAGRFGQVVAGRLQNREPIAIKCIEAPPSGPSLALEPGSLLAREVQILRHCRSAYVVKFMGIAIDPGAQEVQLITERMAGGDLMRLLSGRRIPWRSRGWKLALDVARGLVYLASKRIVHNDLKSSNILLDDEGRAKISDVGLAQMLPGTCLHPGAAAAGGGSFHWCAPEAILGLPCSVQSDIFSMDECGQVDTYWRGQLTSATYFGLLLLHWTVGDFAAEKKVVVPYNGSYVADTLLAAVLGNSSTNNNWKLAARMVDNKVATVSVIDVQGNAVSLPSGVVASYITCGGTRIYVIEQPITPPDFPNVNATSVPGLQDYCWKNIWSAGFRVPGKVSANNPNGPYFKYFSYMSFFMSKYPELYVNLDLAHPMTNVTFLIPDAHVLSRLHAYFDAIPPEEYRRANTATAHYFIDGGRCPDSIEKGRWIPTLAATYLGQNLSVLITPGSEPNKIEVRTSLQPDKVVLGKFLTTSCYGTIYALDDLLPMWDRWQDIPPAEPARYPQVDQDLLFSVNPTCGAGDAIVGRFSALEELEQGSATSGSGGLSAGAIVGIVLGSLALALALAAGLVLAGRSEKARQVFAGHLMNGEPVAIKCVRGPYPGTPLQLASEGCLAEEASILKRCRSAYVVSFVGMAVNPGAGELYLLTHRMAGGDLYALIQKRHVTWNSGGWRIALDIARGLVYLASKRIVHNDLKSSNVLLDGEGRAKISDVGLAKMLPGSKAYPGVMIGVVFWQIITGDTPIRGSMRQIR
ncbi:putative serine/threonine-protein kinase kinX [Auxenochlorella protothecoides]|uniref:Putative serine/threonine-protein kinase kinX n=1 Tax=Auxenochlorella protothecoides TaxID=3075 RepID=A0A087SIB7_AUXPR|nr:putative serine/threonine-protein kinase kinX [Auxenochlorella protothecoides]KFM25471.1 putative serine/threonine-protein kinase kinX [Auxenochlorella protothecoides]